MQRQMCREKQLSRFGQSEIAHVTFGSTEPIGSEPCHAYRENPHAAPAMYRVKALRQGSQRQPSQLETVQPQRLSLRMQRLVAPRACYLRKRASTAISGQLRQTMRMRL